MASFTAAKYTWFSTRSGIDASAPISDHMAAYFASKGFGSNASCRRSVDEMKRDWLVGQGGSWAAALIAASKTPTNNENENEWLFYNTVATSP